MGIHKQMKNVGVGLHEGDLSPTHTSFQKLMFSLDPTLNLMNFQNSSFPTIIDFQTHIPASLSPLWILRLITHQI